MIIVRLEGGLGNIMFQYALGRNLAHKNSSELKFDISSYKTNPLGDYSFSLEGFNINIRDHLANEEEIKYLKRYQKKSGLLGLFYNQFFTDETKYVQEKDASFNPAILNIKDPAYLRGWWQSEQYFYEIRDILLQDFTLRKPLSKKNVAISNMVTTTPSISIHIRRCDYVTNPRTRTYHGELTREYYNAGLLYVTKRIRHPHLFIFSDDIEWAKHNMLLPFETTYIEGNLDSPHADLHLMSLCKYHIIANSSFSWWSAWLSQYDNKIVIAPKKWTNDPRDKGDRIPNSWIKI